MILGPTTRVANAGRFQQHTTIQLCLESTAGPRYEIPLYDPLGDELPFPFPSGVEATRPTQFRYVFDRPVYLRMLRATEERAAETSEPALIGHCVKVGDGPPVGALSLGANSIVRVGTVGTALRVKQLEIGQSSGPREAFSADAALSEEVAVLNTEGAFRFKVVEVVSTIPYPTAVVCELHDQTEEGEAAAAASKLERELLALLARLVELSERLEARGSMAEAASEALSAPAALVEAHEEAILGGTYEDERERWEAFSLAVCEFVDLPYEVAVDALACTSAVERFEILLAQLKPALAEMATLASLDSIEDSMGGPPAPLPLTGEFEGSKGELEGGLQGFTPVDIPVGGGRQPREEETEGLPDGMRIEFWYNEEYQWIAATVRRKLRTPSGLLHSIEFDVDGTWEDVNLLFADGGRRWRPLR